MPAFPQITARYDPTIRSAVRLRRIGNDIAADVEIAHRFDGSSVSDAAVIAVLLTLIERRALSGQGQFESAVVAIVESVPHPDPWTCFYRNTLAELSAHTSAFAPVHRRARREIVGNSVLEVGSCFGFLALACARDGLDVTACDISAGTVSMLATASHALSIGLNACHGDARALPFPDDSFDTVTLIHLLEHLDDAGIVDALGEALRVARHRVVVAVPFESVPSPHFGHRHALGVTDLHRWARTVDHAGARVATDHGGWLVLTPNPSMVDQMSPRLLAV